MATCKSQVLIVCNPNIVSRMKVVSAYKRIVGEKCISISVPVPLGLTLGEIYQHPLLSWRNCSCSGLEEVHS